MIPAFPSVDGVDVFGNVWCALLNTRLFLNLENPLGGGQKIEMVLVLVVVGGGG